jgi:rhamnosyltransferase
VITSAWGRAAPAGTVVIRAKNEALHIGRTLELLRSQTIAERLQIIVVDSGSRDDTPSIAAAAGVELKRLPSHEFSYGGALNLGCESAAGELVIALSAHAFPRSLDWAESMLRVFDDQSIACACGYGLGPTGEPAQDVIAQDDRLASLHPYWGYSNHAGAFRRSLWERRPFRADLPYAEDKEWAWYWLTRGYRVRLDPALEVDHQHVESLRAVYRRVAKMWAAYGMFMDLPPYRLRDLGAEWRAEPSVRRRASPYRLATLLGTYRGRRFRSARR